MHEDSPTLEHEVGNTVHDKERGLEKSRAKMWFRVKKRVINIITKQLEESPTSANKNDDHVGSLGSTPSKKVKERFGGKKGLLLSLGLVRRGMRKKNMRSFLLGRKLLAS